MYENIEKFVSMLMDESTPDKPMWNIESIRAGKTPHWNYIDGCMLTSLLALHEITGEEKYFSFAENYVDWYVFDDGSIRGYDMEKYNLDDINEGRVLFELYEKTGKEKYRLAAELLKKQLNLQPRTDSGNYWHKLTYPNQVWLDGVYMVQVFSAMWQKNSAVPDYSDIFAQIKNVRKYMFDAEKRLYYHGWDCSRTAFWCDKESGCSANFWLRSIGWFLVAMADIIGICAEDAAREGIADIFREAINGVAAYMDEASHMFWQVVDCGNREGNYLETSGSSMIAYAMLKGARLGVIDARYSALGKAVFDGICEKYLISDGERFDLGGICLVAGLGPENNRRRDGSYEYYISEPIVQNDAKGVAPFILCYTEIKRLYNE